MISRFTSIKDLIHALGFNGIIGIIILLVLIMGATFAPLMTTFTPYEMDQGKELQSPDSTHIAGTDEFGRDIFARTLYGARYSLGVSFVCVILAMIIGGIFGLIAGFWGKRIDSVIMRFVDIILAFPPVLVGIIVITILGPGTMKIAIAIIISNIPRFTRFMRSAVYQEIAQEYVEAARALGVSKSRILFGHILPNTLSFLFVEANIAMVNAILLEAGLSFIGMGAQVPEPAWGLMLQTARAYLYDAAFYALAPGIALSALVLALNFLTDSFRNLLDPRRI